jgi:hypothetical protein
MFDVAGTAFGAVRVFETAFGAVLVLITALLFLAAYLNAADSCPIESLITCLFPIPFARFTSFFASSATAFLFDTVNLD